MTEYFTKFAGRKLVSFYYFGKITENELGFTILLKKTYSVTRTNEINRILFPFF